MLSFNNDPAVKAVHVAQAEHHLAADMLRSGTYGEGSGKNFRACSVGCFAHDIDAKRHDKHELIAETRSLPVWLVRLQDSIFEGLPEDQRGVFHVELAKRIPVGVDLEPVQHWLAMARIVRMLETQRKALEAKHAHDVHDAIQQVIASLEIGRRAHEAAAGGNTCELSAAWSAAWSAAESAAESARSAAWSAAESARSAWSAAWSAAESAAESAARSAAESARSAARSAAESAQSAARSAAESARSAARSAAESARSAAWSAAESARSAAWSAAESARSAARSAAESARSAAWINERNDLFAALDRAK